MSEAELANAIAAAAVACPAVASLSRGSGLRNVATYLPGRRVDGVRIESSRVLVSVVAVQGVPIIAIADQVRRAVEPLVAGQPVDVHVADLQLPEEQPPALPPGPSGVGVSQA
ncbi:hypothetical protein DQ237_19200 [Blastococcus sp. TF02-8]|uniref:hypothetical protein n=1 Tax=Blastococcus sp. TF02-8 TaxID=2250574 RepID=UPI000DE9BA7B|nr:hypothetical protein [Blastococcus sp. TF02-8]RBY91954.1 hypothetical protein DQ237_19200 [Blastococcus sp. TF02-8]